MNKMITINCSTDDLIQDIRMTKDPIKRTILKKFLAIKVFQLRTQSIAEPPVVRPPVVRPPVVRPPVVRPPVVRPPVVRPSVVRPLTNKLSTVVNNQNNQDIKCKISDTFLSERPSKAEHELSKIIKQQNDGLNELDKLAKIKGYVDMLGDNKREEDIKEIEKNRGKGERAWECKSIYDPRYVKYQKDDTMNNKMMERLNSEIDFRLDECGKMKIENPFDDEEPRCTEEFAKYEPVCNDKTKHITKTRGKPDIRKKIYSGR